MSALITLTANAPLVVQGRQATTKSSTATLTDAEVLSGLLLITAQVDITLPAASSGNAGADLYVSTTTASARLICQAGFHGGGSSADALTLAARVGCHIYSDGNNWYLLGSGPGCSLG